MMKYNFILPVLFSLLGLPIFAQQDTGHMDDKVKDEALGQLFVYDMSNILGGMGYAYSRPLHWQGKQWQQFGATMSGTALLFLIDEPVHDFASDLEKDIPQAIQDYGWYYGSPQNNYMLTGAVYLTGLFTKNEKLRRTGVLLISSATTAGLLQQTSKYLFGRARPRSGDNPTSFKPFEADKDYHSFPSGHAILAFTNAYAISKQFNNKWIKGGIWVIGSVPGISRLWEGAHWLSDVALSAAISVAIVESIDRYLDHKYSEKYNHKDKRISWDLQFGGNQLGIVVRF